MRKFFIVVLSVLLIMSCSEKQNKMEKAQNFTNVNTEEFKKIIDSGDVQILDVRTQKEYDEGHIKDAVLIDYKTDAFLGTVKKKLHKDKTVAIYCRSGRRSASAAEMLTKEGYNVINLLGGIIAWRRDSKEIE
jgi:rhodanese-related sulfurtransferase